MSLAATAEYTDTRGLAGSASFPVPRVLVLAEAPTPSPTVTPTVDPGPTQTPSRTPVTPATPEPTATRKPGSGGPGWHPLYMPLAVNSWCLRDEPNEHLGGCR